MSLAHRVSAMNRYRKWSLFMGSIASTADMTVLDVGFSEQELSPTDNFIEKHYPFPKRLTALGVDEPRGFARKYPEVTTVQYDGRRFPFADGQFDVCWSNAVLEHVGGPERQVEFLSETRRVSRMAFVTTPNRCFPIEVHTRTLLLDYLPKTWFDKFLVLCGRDWASGEYMHLLTESQLRTRLARADVTDYCLVKNRLFGFTLDFVVLAGVADDRCRRFRQR